MPYDTVFHRWKKGTLHSGSKRGPVVKSQRQAVAIYLSEKKKAAQGNKEYAAARRAALRSAGAASRRKMH